MKTRKPQSMRLRFAAPAIAGLILMANASAQTTLVNEDWQSPLLTNGTSNLTTQFSGWTFSTGDQSGAVSRRRDASGDLPGDSTGAPTNQAIELNGDSTYGEINIAHNWAATDVYYLRIEVSPNSWTGSSQRWIRPELRQQNGTVLWAAPQDSTTAVPLYSTYMNALTDYPSELTFFFKIDASTFTAGAAGQLLRLRLDGSGQRSLYVNKVSLVLGPLPEDTTPPAPDPLTWDIVPTVSNFTTISMRIRSARDGGDLYGVEYYFENTVRGTNSGWQNSREWAETGLDYDTLYTYRVKSRDKSPNANESTTWSADQSATTPLRDLTAPSPDPLIWQTVPTVADYRSITMTVNAATDLSGVEYYFENVTNSTNSGWIAARSWTQKDLAPNTLYTYRVKARDKSLDQNVSINWSTEESATTPTEPANTLFITRFQDPLIPHATGAPNLGNWVITGGTNVKMVTATNDGVRTDTSIATTNQAIQFEYAENYIEYNIPHNWSATDTFTLTINASPQSWNGGQQRYVRPSLREQDGTVLWAPGENLSGPQTTGLPLSANLDGSSYQSDDSVAPPVSENGTTVNFTYTIPASAFSGAGVTPGQPIRLRIGSSGFRGLFIDNVHLSVSNASGPTGYAAWATGNEPFDGDANGDDVKNGIAFLLGAANPSEDASRRLPTVTETAGGLVLNFDCLPIAARGGATLKVAHSNNHAAWSPTVAAVPDATDPTPDNHVTFVVGAGPAGPPALNSVTATIGSAAAAGGGKLFGRLEATE